MVREFASAQLAAIQARFHELIRHRAVDEGRLELTVELPILSANLEDYAEKLWFPVPGMHGGFAYQMVMEDGTPVLMTESWCRVVEGSGRAHRITASTTELIATGFV
jgi:hypothetical protein